MRTRRLWALAFALGLLTPLDLPAQLSAPAAYRVVDLGSLQQDTGAHVRGLNNLGALVGGGGVEVTGVPLDEPGAGDHQGAPGSLPQVFEFGTGAWRNLTNAQLGLPLYPQMLLAPDGRVFNPGPSQTTRYLDTSGTGSGGGATWTRQGGAARRSC
jgi:hypothetical protein